MKKGTLWFIFGSGIGAGLVWWFCCRKRPQENGYEALGPASYTPPAPPEEKPSAEALLAELSRATMRSTAPRSVAALRPPREYILE